jgi:hypothetical protein
LPENFRNFFENLRELSGNSGALQRFAKMPHMDTSSAPL